MNYPKISNFSVVNPWHYLLCPECLTIYENDLKLTDAYCPQCAAGSKGKKLLNFTTIEQAEDWKRRFTENLNDKPAFLRKIMD